MLCVVVTHPEQMQQVVHADIAELRVDLFPSLDFYLRTDLPIILTIRSQNQGGNFKGSQTEQLNLISSLSARLKPAYVDLEFGVSLNFVQAFKQQHPQIKIILSYHNFDQTPENLEQIFLEMKHFPADVYKIATKANSAADAMKLLRMNDSSTAAMAMGEWANITRVLGTIFNASLTYASINDQLAVAPGQIAVNDLVDVYHYHALKNTTKIYALIGDPVDLSISHLTHNQVMRTMGLDAVYLKIKVQSDELESFFAEARKLPFGGLSVTMPLKEAVIPFLDHIDPLAEQIGAVNTLLFREGKLWGFNTDGIGAMDAIETQTKVKNKKVVILGAGGSAKAIAYVAKHRGAHVQIVNRDPIKAEKLAAKLDCAWGTLSEYDILINCTPNPMPVDSASILPEKHVMDIKTKPKFTQLLKEAIEKECSVTYGVEMFVMQAVKQFAIWFDQKKTKNLKEKLAENAVKAV